MQPHPVAAGVAAAVALREPRALAAALTENVRLRALLLGAAIVAHGSADVAACFQGWFADFDTVEVLESAGEAVADRLLIHYRLALIQRETRWVCTHTAICKVVDGRPAVIDLLCSGFRETGVTLSRRSRASAAIAPQRTRVIRRHVSCGEPARLAGEEGPGSRKRQDRRAGSHLRRHCDR